MYRLCLSIPNFRRVEIYHSIQAVKHMVPVEVEETDTCPSLFRLWRCNMLDDLSENVLAVAKVKSIDCKQRPIISAGSGLELFL